MAGHLCHLLRLGLESIASLNVIEGVTEDLDCYISLQADVEIQVHVGEPAGSNEPLVFKPLDVWGRMHHPWHQKAAS